MIIPGLKSNNAKRSMMLKTRSFLGVLVAVLCMNLSGCSGSTDQPEVADVSGVVTLDGKPVAGVNVIFQPESGRAAVGMTNEDGEYELEYLHGVKGCKLGSNTVGFDWPPDSPNMVAIPPRHTGANAFKFDVKAEGNVFDIPMTSK